MPKKRIKLKPAKKGSFTDQVVGPLNDVYQDVQNGADGVLKGARKVSKLPGMPKLPRK